MINKVYDLLKKKQLVWSLLALPGIFYFIVPFFMGDFEPEPWKFANQNTGIIAVSVFVASLALNPLRIVFPKIKLFKVINRHRRSVGVAAFIYAVLHLFCYYMKKGSLAELLPYLLHPVIAPAVLAFIIMLVLAVTSNDSSVKRLGHQAWKKIHNKVYFAEFFVFIHMILQRPNVKILAVSLFIPLFVLQRLRFRIEKKNKASQK